MQNNTPTSRHYTRKSKTAAKTPFNKNAWGTPQSLFEQLNQEFNFTLDAAADSTNHKCPVFFTKEQDALTQKWEGRVFVNPSYQTSVLKGFVAKAATSVLNGDAELVVMVIPAATDTTWWQEWIFPHASEIRFIKGRVKFVKPGSGNAEGEDPSNFGASIVIFKGSRGVGESVKVVPADVTGKACLQMTSIESSAGEADTFRFVRNGIRPNIPFTTKGEAEALLPQTAGPIIENTASAKKHGRPELYTADRLAQLVTLVRGGMTVKAAMAEFNNETGLKFTYVPLLVASRRHGIEFCEIAKSAKASTKSVTPKVDLSSLTPKTPYMVLNGESSQILKGLPNGSVNLVVTSPPYTTPHNVPRKNADYNAFYNFDAVFTETVRVMAPGSFLLLDEDALVDKWGPNQGGRSLEPYRHAIKLVELGLIRFDKITWNKKQAQFPGGLRQSHSTESIEVFYKPPMDPSQITILKDRPNECEGQHARINSRNADGTLVSTNKTWIHKAFGRRTDIWSYSVGFGRGKSYDKHYLASHPAIMHQGLVADLIKSFVRPIQANGQTSVVLDVFGGAFTTPNEAIKQGMFGIGIEISPNYCALGKRRLEDTQQEIRSKEDSSTSLNTPVTQPKETTMNTIDLSKLPAMKNSQAVLVEQEAITPTPSKGTSMTTPNTQEPAMNDILTLSQITDLGCQDIPAVVEGLIPSQGVCIIGGASGSKKTWATLSLALEASRGGVWLGYQTTKTNVYYVDAEMAQLSLGNRVRSLCLGKGMSLDGADIVFKSNGAMNLKDDGCLEALKADIRKHKVGMLVLDPLVSMVARFSENSASDVAKVFKILKALADEFSMAVVVVDHHTKAGTELRGCGAKKGYADTVLAVSKTSKGQSEVSIRKNRHWGSEEKVVCFELTPDGCPQGGLKLRVVEKAEEERSAPELRLVQDIAPTILSRLAGGQGVGRKDLIAYGKTQGHSFHRMNSALKDLEAAGRILKQKDTLSKKRGNKAFIYHLVATEVGFQEAA